jgi:aminopeptidase N
VRRPRLLAASAIALVLAVTGSAASGVVESAAPRPGSAGIGDPYFRLDGNGGIDVLSYDVHDRYEFAARRLSGWTDLRIRGTAAVTSFNLDFLLPVRSVRVQGRSVRFRQRPHEVTVRRPLRDGEVVRVRVRYAGRPDRKSYGGESNWLAGRGEVVAMNEPHMAPWWFPANDHPRDRARLRVSITVPVGFDVISNGSRVGRKVRGGLATVTWRAAEPMVPYLAFFAAGRFQVARGSAGGRPWLVAVSRGLGSAERRTAMGLMRRTPELLTWLEGVLGDYPFSTVGGLTTALPVDFALENQTRPTYPYLGDGPAAVDTVVHELAHQWFGDSVAVHSWRDIWLNEGAATFLEWYYGEVERGWSADARMRAKYDGTGAGDDFWAHEVADPCPSHRDCVPRIFANFVYERGAMTLQALRNRIGDDAVFWTLLRRWVDERAGGTGTTAQFEALAEEVSGLDLDGFFDAWLHSTTKPGPGPDNGLG